MSRRVLILAAAALAACAAPEPAPQGAPPEAASSAAPAPADLDEFLAGSDLLYKGETEEALRLLRQFLQEAPGSPYADDAQFAIGEAYYRARDYERAVEELAEVPRRYPHGDHVPTALLRKAFAFERLGDAPAARRTLETLVRDHAASPEAELGRRKLAALEE